ncbi:hypothetical protein [Fluviispira multicolorata]|uniref:Uncharacterized protein n=1 Tax=Fluviispira multicolorata TaxID=2654512 RepID=A0A833N3T6_9BACT|nr:hypothetical protein [Fluviispira multicolorata]KAB8029167.1 hypothetical protein GCL57_11565 [Fluviispira multicolorata]
MDDPSGTTTNKNQDSFHFKDQSISLERTVYYIPNTVPTNQYVFSALKNVCKSFEDILILLEEGKIDKIIFHPLTSPQDRKYIVHWAKVFNPNIIEQLNTHFPSKAHNPHQVA